MSERRKQAPAGGAAARDAREEDDLFETFAALRDADEAGRFLRDIATPGEIAAFAERWRIARLLDEGALSYREIAAATGASTTTVARVARFLKEEPHRGYRLMIDRMRKSERRKASRT
ncbi:YerC/YecD family TrpR-related protein [Amphiplicatus metriothermophilus]|uniref:Trp operon repressor family n=1 Tax=Amphiplicatus metriothermophilus TaxID=1519374 RepID=A0A239PTJ2_9PROT|nr:YerC/YecD family TrpR-related protein [Amphiplicatus metriothermophilus]MBB5519274.1 TrpR-related protein YerC/YecD [Amphiplicatus metriothermophilus]SNT73343.1 Trp operon repressor family [Amphiplicatus metriothermophilus]